MLPQGFGNFPSVFSRERWRNLAIKSMMVDLEVDATLDDDFYYYCFFYSQKELSFTRSYLQFFSEKSYKWMWDLRTLIQVQGSGISPGLLQDFMDGYIKFLRLPALLVQLRLPFSGTPTQQSPNQWL